MNAETAGHAGTPQSKLLVMENIKELRKRNRAGSIDGAMLPDSQSDQAISTSGSTERSDKRSTGPGPKQQARTNEQRASNDQQASKVSSTVDHDPRATDEQAKPSLKRS